MRIFLTSPTHYPNKVWGMCDLHICYAYCVYTVYNKTFEGENFRSFCAFSLNCKCFPRIMALSIGNVSLQHASVKVFLRMESLYPNHESFPTRKFSHLKVLPYTVVVYSRSVALVIRWTPMHAVLEITVGHWPFSDQFQH